MRKAPIIEINDANFAQNFLNNKTNHMEQNAAVKTRVVSKTTQKLLVALAVTMIGGGAFAVVQNQSSQTEDPAAKSMMINKKPLIADPKGAVEAVNNFSGIVKSIRTEGKHSILTMHFSVVDSSKVTSEMIEESVSLPMIEKDMDVSIDDKTVLAKSLKEKDLQVGDFLYIEVEGNIYTDSATVVKIERIQSAK